MAFDELFGIAADIGEFTDPGMTDPDVGRSTFEGVMHREPERKEFTRLLERRGAVPRIIDDGYLLGLVTGNLEASAHIKLHRAGLNRFFSFGGYGSDSNDRGELTKIALRRAAYVYGEPVTPAQAITVGDTPVTSRRRTPPESPASAWAALTSLSSSSGTRARTTRSHR